MNRKARRTAAKQLRSSDVAGTNESTVQLLIDQAVTAAQAAQWAEAERILRHVLAVDPGHAEALHLIGMTLASLGRAVEGVEFLKRATALVPNQALYWNNLSICYAAAARPGDAVEAGRKAIILEPGYAAAWSSLGDAYGDLKDYASAKEAYQRYEALAGSELGVQKRIANCFINLGELAEAETYLRAARDVAPADVDVLSNLGNVLAARGQFAEAAACLEKAVAGPKPTASMCFNYARALRGLDDRPAAIRWLRKATSLDHRAVDAWAMLADLSLKAGDLAEAKVAARRVAELVPNNPAATELMRRVKAATPAATPAPPTGPVMWDFHLGDGNAPVPAAGPLDVVFVDGPVKDEKPAAAKKPSADGVFDLTILKID